MPLITTHQAAPTTLAEAQALKQPDTMKTVENPVTPGEKIPEEASATPAEESASQRLAKWAQKEKALHQQRKQIQAERAELQKLQEELKSVQGWKANLTKDPLAVLNEAGLTYDQLTQLVLNGGASQDPDALERKQIRQELDAIKQAQEAEKKAAEERVTQQFDQTRKQLKNEVVSAIHSNPAYARVSEMKAEEAAVELIVQRFHQDGKILSAEEASEAVSEHLREEQLEFLKLPSVQELLKEMNAVQPPTAGPASVIPAKKPALPNRTLSSSMNSVSKPSKYRSWIERRDAAIAKVTGKQS